jgi:hypothetical protein
MTAPQRFEMEQPARVFRDRLELTIQYLEWIVEQIQVAEKRVLVMFWNHASWHVSKMVRAWAH